MVFYIHLGPSGFVRGAEVGDRALKLQRIVGDQGPDCNLCFQFRVMGDYVIILGFLGILFVICNTTTLYSFRTLRGPSPLPKKRFLVYYIQYDKKLPKVASKSVWRMVQNFIIKRRQTSKLTEFPKKCKCEIYFWKNHGTCILILINLRLENKKELNIVILYLTLSSNSQ
jgi:hypothetical protein